MSITRSSESTGIKAFAGFRASKLLIFAVASAIAAHAFSSWPRLDSFLSLFDGCMDPYLVSSSTLLQFPSFAFPPLGALIAPCAHMRCDWPSQEVRDWAADSTPAPLYPVETRGIHFGSPEMTGTILQEHESTLRKASQEYLNSTRHL
jgi:hypothetical protein